MSALIVEHLSVERGGARLIDDASARFALGGVHAVVGRSGAGKSVLMKAATGLMEASHGRVSLDGMTADAGDARAFARLRERVVFVHQDPALMDDLAIDENVAFAGVRLLPRGLARERAARAMAQLSLIEHGRALPRDVSPGVLRRAALARALVLEPSVLVVDEPTTGVDPVTARDVDATLVDVARRGTTLIVITHDRRSVRALAPHITFVDAGRVAFQGTLDDAHRSGPASLARLLFDESSPSTSGAAPRPAEAT